MSVPNLAWDDLRNSGYVVDTLVAGFWGLLHGADFEDTLVRIVNRGNDADSCGAVVGALCGAYYGAKKIPMRWLEKLECPELITDSLMRLGTEL